MSNTELKPCPFCGGVSEMIHGGLGCRYTRCTKCHASSDDSNCVEAWNARSPQTTDGQVRVKPLEWDNFGSSLYADGAAGRYYIGGYGDKWFWRFSQANPGSCEIAVKSESEAVNAANSHNLNRILSALEPADTWTIQALAEKAGDGTLSAVVDVINERYRQIAVEGFDLAHDDKHVNGEMAFAAACYAVSGAVPEDQRGKDNKLLAAIQFIWPRAWSWGWWTPKSRRRDLIRSAALLIAEIERLDRIGDAS